MVTLSLGSARPATPHTCLEISGRAFPDRATGEPQHTVTVGLLSREDLEYLQAFLTEYLASDEHE